MLSLAPALVPLSLLQCEQAPAAPPAVAPPGFQAQTLVNSSCLIIDQTWWAGCANGGQDKHVLMNGSVHVLEGTAVLLSTQWRAPIQFDELPHVTTFVDNRYFIGQCPSNNFKLHQQATGCHHWFKIAPNHRVKSRTRFPVPCRGESLLGAGSP